MINLNYFISTCELFHLETCTYKILGVLLMKTNELKWAIFILVIVLLAYVLPYTLLTDITKWYGSFLVWIVLALITIVINYFLTKDWGK
jgi:hypothetical protein